MIDLDKEMTEFFRRSVASNPATGIPPKFEIERTVRIEPTRQVIVEEVSPRVTLLETASTAPPIPTISTVTPPNGKLAGGASVTIVGTNFISGAKVYIDNIEATSVVFVDDTHLTCNAPAYTHGTPPSGAALVDVKVKNIDSPGNTFQVIKTDSYSYYVSPTVASVTPNNGPGTGGTAVTIVGTNFIFSSGYIAGFGGSYANTTRVDSTHLTCSTPPHATGVVNVTVVAPDAEHQTGALVGGYTYGAPAGTPGAQAIFVGIPSFSHTAHGANLSLQIHAISSSSGTVDTTYNGVIHPVIMGISSNANATLPNVTMASGVGTLNLQVFLVNLHASGDLYINFTENIFTNNAVFEVYIDRFFNP